MNFLTGVFAAIGSIINVLITLFGGALLEGIVLWVSYPAIIYLFPILTNWIPLSIGYWDSAMIMAFLSLIITTISKLWKK